MWQPSRPSRAKAALLLSLASASLAFAAPLDCTNGESNNTIYETATGSYDILCQVDYAGGDVAAQGGLASFEACIELCDATPACIDVSYAPGGTCYMKSTLGDPNPNGGIWTARSRSLLNSDAVSCVDNKSNGTVYETPDGSYFRVLCGLDYAGADLAVTSEPTFSSCLNACGALDGCVDVSFVSPSCYLKGAVTTAVRRSFVWTGLKVSKPISSTARPEGTATGTASSVTETLTGTSSAATATSTEPSSTNYTSPAGAVYEVIYDLEYYGGDLSAMGAATFKDCIAMCDWTTGCLDVSWVNGMCYMKQELNELVIADGVSTAKKITGPTVKVKAPLTCELGVANSTTFNTERGNFYEILCGYDFPGGDIQAVSAESFEKCLDACDRNLECADVAYVAPTCYLKRDVNPATPAAAGVWGARSVPEPIPGPTSSEAVPEPTSSEAVPEPTSSEPVPEPTSSEPVPESTSSEPVPESTSEPVPESTSASTLESTSEPVPESTSAPNFESTSGPVSESTSSEPVPESTSSEPVPESTSAPTLESTSEAVPESTSEPVPESTSASTLESTSELVTESTSAPTPESTSAPTLESTSALVPESTSAPTLESTSEPVPESTSEPVSESTSALVPEATPEPGCAALSTTLYPVGNTDVDRSSLDTLLPSLEATLNYAEKRPGTKAASLVLSMAYPQITLENTDLLSVTCSEGSVTVEASTLAIQQYVMSNWPSAGLVLFTNSAGCNNETSRGIYLTTAAYATKDSRAITFSVTAETYATVAREVAIQYGTVDYPSAEAAPTATQYSSTCSETGTVTASASGTASATAQTSLSPEVQAFYEAVKSAIKYDEDGNIIMHPKNLQDVELVPNAFDLDDTSNQAALEDMFSQWGVEAPAKLSAEGASGAQGGCEAPTKTTPVSARRVAPKARRSSGSLLGKIVSAVSLKLAKRLSISWKDVQEFGCSDFVTGLVGEANEGIGAALEGGCVGAEAAQNGENFGCVIMGGCFYTSTVITYYTPPPATVYNFDYSWKLTLPSLVQRTVRGMGPGKLLSCENCGFSISSIRFSGQIVINMTAGVIKEASMTAGLSGMANLVAGLKADAPWTGSWDYTFSNTELGSISIDSAFNIVPTVLYGIGIGYDTDAAVSTTGGAQFELKDASVTMDLLKGNILSQKNWAPQISFANPAFTTGANVQLTPFMRWAVNLAVNIYGQVALSQTITSETVVGLGSKYSFSAQGSCPANNLQVTSYVSSKNKVTNGMGSTNVLYSDQQFSSPKCFNVPSVQPSPDELAALRVSAQEYCTSYINYKPPTVYEWITTSVTVPSTTTAYTLVTVTSTPKITTTVITTKTTYFTYTRTASTVHVSATNNAVFPTGYNLKRGLGGDGLITAALLPQETGNAASKPSAAGPLSGPALRFDRRAAAPAVVAGWPASKISYGCSVIATGKATVTSTATSATTSGLTTVTMTNTANAVGPLVTVTATFTTGTYSGFTAVTVAGTTTVTDWSCPLQTQVPANSCIKVQAHGPPHIDGQYLGFGDHSGNPDFHPANPYQTWYLSCAGQLQGFFGSGFKVMGGLPGARTWMLINGSPAATCVKRPATNALDCALPDDPNPIMIMPADQATIGIMNWNIPNLGGQGRTLDARVYVPTWGTTRINASVISLTYEEVPCPCV